MFPLGLHLDFFEKKQKNLSYIEPFNLENEKDIFNMVFGIKTIKSMSKKNRSKSSKNKSSKLGAKTKTKN
jgi:hypothetical protein